jgi:methyl-accepting chemotaxis protein
MAITTVALSVVAVQNARHHAALTDEFESANAGTWNVERVNGLIYAVVMESRGVYMSPDLATSKVYADGIINVWRRPAMKSISSSKLFQRRAKIR